MSKNKYKQSPKLQIWKIIETKTQNQKENQILIVIQLQLQKGF